MDRRALLAGSAAGLWAASARAQQACFDRLDCFNTRLPGPSLDLQFTSGVLDPRITFTRASVASYFDVAGTLQSAASGAPRFDYDPVTHAAKGLLIEEARTNLLLNSATLGTQSVTTAATPYTLSFYGTGTVTLTGTSTAGPLTGSGAFPQRVSQTFTPTAGTLTLTVSGSVLNANLEAGSFATSAIVTAGASATRAADVATMPTGSWFNPAAGTLMAQGSSTAGATVNCAWFEIDDGGATNMVVNFFHQSDNQAIVRNRAGGANFDLISGGAVMVDGAVARVAASYVVSSGATALSVNAGTVVSASTPYTLTAPLTTLRIGANQVGTQQMNGSLRRLPYWPRALGTAELQGVTR